MAAQAGINQHPPRCTTSAFSLSAKHNYIELFSSTNSSMQPRTPYGVEVQIFIHLSLSSVRLVLADSQFKVSCNSPKIKQIIRSHRRYLQNEDFQYLSLALNFLRRWMHNIGLKMGG